MKNSKWPRLLTARSRTRAALNFAFLILNFELAVLVTACGGNAPENASLAPSLEGTQRDDLPAKNLPPAPTDAHLILAKLLPTVARDDASITYCGWNAEQAQSYTDEKEGAGAVKAAPLPCVRARYSSTGFEKVESGEKGVTTAKHTFPQVCDLFIIQAPAPDAAEAIQRKIEARLTEKRFSLKSPLKVTSGNPNQPGITISQWLRVDEEKEQDTAYVAYTNVVGSLVIYALETEVRKPLIGPNKEEIRLPTTTQLGNRVGGGLIMLVNHTLSR